MALELTGLGAQAALDQIAKMAYGSKTDEGISGGLGNIGIIDGKVAKFNTHWTERLGFTTPAMRASCDALRLRLSNIATELLALPPNADETVQASRQQALEDIRKSLGLDPSGQHVVSTRLLDRKIVAAVVTKLADAGAHNAWQGQSQDELHALSSRGVTTSFNAVSDSVKAERAAALSQANSIPRTQMNDRQRQVFCDHICNSAPETFEECFSRSLAESFHQSEADLGRGQRTILNGQAFGRGANDDLDAYRQAVAQMFNGNEKLVRFFNTFAHQGFCAAAIFARIEAFDEHDYDNRLKCSAPFGDTEEGQNMDYTFTVSARNDGNYEMDFTYNRRGRFDVNTNGKRRPLDRDRSLDQIKAKVVFGLAQPDDPHARTLNYTDEQGVSQTLTYHFEVVSAESELKFTYLSADPVHRT